MIPAALVDMPVRHRAPLLVAALLALLTVEAYWGVWRLDFVELDDADYVYENERLADGLSWRGLYWAGNTYASLNWHPLTWLSFLIDYQLFGARPAGYHAVNLAFHVVNVGLLFLVFTRLTGRFWPSAVVAALFAVHPLHVESVAWISERKDVLSTCFFLLALWAYAGYVGQPNWRRYVGMLLLYALSLLAKPMAVTFPCLLLLLDYWPLERTRSIGWRRLVVEKLPAFVLAGGDSWLTVRAQRGAVSPLGVVGAEQRLGNATLAYAEYIRKMFWPSDLSPLYLLPAEPPPAWQVLAAASFLAAISILIFWFGRKQPYLVVGWLWYLGTLVPVIGLVQVGQQRLADRYTYVPLIGLFVLLTWLPAELAARQRRWRILLPLLTSVLLLACVGATRQQLPHWRTTDTLWAQALRVEPDNHAAHAFWAAWLRYHGEVDRAREHLAEAVRLVPYRADYQNDYAVHLLAQGRAGEALPHLEEAVRLEPQLAAAWFNFGLLRGQQAQWREARECLLHANELRPCDARYRRELAYACQQTGQATEARVQYGLSRCLDPEWPDTACRAVERLLSSNDPDRATALVLATQAAEALDEPPADVLEILATALAENGRFSEAAAAAQRALARAGDRRQAERLQERVEVYRQRGAGVWLADNTGRTAVKRTPAVHDPLTLFLRRGEYTTDGTAGAQRCGDCWPAGD